MAEDEHNGIWNRIGEHDDLISSLEKKLVEQIIISCSNEERIEKLECKVAENREYSIQLKELIDKLGAKDGDSKCSKCIYNFPKFIFWCEKCRDYSEFNPKLLNDGEKSVSTPDVSARKDKEASNDTDSTPSKCKFYDTKTDICNNEMWDFCDEPGSCVLWGQKGCSKFEPKETPEGYILVEKAELRQLIGLSYFRNETFSKLMEEKYLREA